VREVGTRILQLRLSGTDVRCCRAHVLSGLGERRFRLGDGKLVALRVDPHQDLASRDPLVVGHVHFGHEACDLGRDRDDEGIDGGLRGEWRQPIGEEMVDEQEGADAEDDECPPSDRPALGFGPGLRHASRRLRDLRRSRRQIRRGAHDIGRPVG
jgi:hypothetical protein